MTVIKSVATRDKRYQLPHGAGSDSVHAKPLYAYAVTELQADGAATGTGLALTLGEGNDLVCRAIDALAAPLVGRDIEELMAEFGTVLRAMADHPRYRWLGPHKGVVHLALASIVNACFDLWARSRGLPLWRLLLDLSPEQLVALLDLSYLEDVLTHHQAVALLRSLQESRSQREDVLNTGYPGYDTSVGWFQYSDERLKENLRRAVDGGFTAVKLKVGSKDFSRDLRRARLIRGVAGDALTIMFDCNQQWTLRQAVSNCLALAEVSPLWIEEPTHPDDVRGHAALAQILAPTRVAAGEHLPNSVVFKNYLQAQALGFCQVDCTRVAGISEFLTVSLLARKFGVPVVPHVGDMGQIHQHLVLFNRIALDHEAVFLEYIPHLREHFTEPATVTGGVYMTPKQPGCSTGLN